MSRAAGRRLLIVVNELQWLWTHRLPVAQGARAAGWDVQVISPPSTFRDRIEALGFPVHEILLPRADSRPVAVLENARTLRRAYRRIRPTLAHHVTLRPVLAGSLAVRSGIDCAVVNAIAGLGSGFIGEGLAARARRRTLVAALRLALNVRRSRIVFQNQEDRELCIAAGLVDAGRAVVIHGAGVDLSAFQPSPLPQRPVVLYVGRLVRDKGVGEFIEAARLVRARRPDVTFRLCGEPDPANPTSVTDADVRQWVDDGTVEWLGQRWDMPHVYADATLVALPSYREGLPKALLEAGASGRASIASDAPGCREVIRHGVNGLLVPVRDGEALARAIEEMLANDIALRTMGTAARRIVEEEYGVDGVVAETLALYDVLAPA